MTIVLSRKPTHRVLSVREREIAGLAAAGMTNREICAALRISEQTAKNTLRAAFSTLGIHKRAELKEAIQRHDAQKANFETILHLAEAVCRMEAKS